MWFLSFSLITDLMSEGAKGQVVYSACIHGTKFTFQVGQSKTAMRFHYATQNHKLKTYEPFITGISI